MELRTVLSIAGKPGLFKLVAQNKGGVVVESLLDGKRTSISASANVSSLGDIAIYTYEEEVPLREVFKAMSAATGGKEALSHKSAFTQAILKRSFSGLIFLQRTNSSPF
jgi:hypothetical protein